MSSAPFDLRMPRLEGHLILNVAALFDSPQTSDRSAWSEKWCSLEDGCLLIYHDRTAAIVSPDEPICSIDLRSFAHVQLAPPHTDALHNFVISRTPLESLKSSRLFRPKSAMSLNRLPSDSVPRDATDQEHAAALRVIKALVLAPPIASETGCIVPELYSTSRVESTSLHTNDSPLTISRRTLFNLRMTDPSCHETEKPLETSFISFRSAWIPFHK